VCVKRLPCNPARYSKRVCLLPLAVKSKTQHAWRRTAPPSHGAGVPGARAGWHAHWPRQPVSRPPRALAALFVLSLSLFAASARGARRAFQAGRVASHA
jgi:hypothetical protein